MAEHLKRQIAYKVRVSEILSGSYVKREGWDPSSIVVEGLEISRVNLIATVVSPPEAQGNVVTALLDDGTAKISARSFDSKSQLASMNIGDVVQVIGRPREFGGERYLIPEIVRKISNSSWIKVRAAELKSPVQKQQVEHSQLNVFLASKPTAFEIIKKLDDGDGAVFELVVKSIGSQDAEKEIELLLKDGEIFEIRPGRLKVLD